MLTRKGDAGRTSTTWCAWKKGWDKIKRLYVDRGKYFVINRGRQYGKTTTLMALAEYLTEEYAVLPMDFQALGTDNFADGPTFVVSFIEYLEEIFSRKDGLKDVMCPDAYQSLVALKAQERKGLDKLFRGSKYGAGMHIGNAENNSLQNTWIILAWKKVTCSASTSIRKRRLMSGMYRQGAG